MLYPWLTRFFSWLKDFFVELFDAQALSSQNRPEYRRVLIDDPDGLAKTSFSARKLTIRLRYLASFHPALFGPNNHHVIIDLDTIWRCAVALSGNAIWVRVVYRTPGENDAIAQAWERQLRRHLDLLDHPARTGDLDGLSNFSHTSFKHFLREIEHRLNGLGEFCKNYVCSEDNWDRYLDIYSHYKRNVIFASDLRQRSAGTENTLDLMHRFLLYRIRPLAI